MTDAPTVRRTYPWTTSVDGVRLTFRLMEPSDRDAILAFARALPNDDLIFLRSDITESPAVDAWMNYIKTGRTISVVAEAGGKIAGYASIHLNDALWTRHVGELRVLVGRSSEASDWASGSRTRRSPSPRTSASRRSQPRCRPSNGAPARCSNASASARRRCLPIT